MNVTVLILAATVSLGLQDADAQQPPVEDVAAPEMVAEPMMDEPLAETEPAAQLGSAEGAIDRGLQAWNRRRYSAAEEAFREAVAADPNSAAAAFYLGYTIYKRAEPRTRLTPQKEEARALFVKAYELDPGFKPVWALPRGEPEPEAVDAAEE